MNFQSAPAYTTEVGPLRPSRANTPLRTSSSLRLAPITALRPDTCPTGNAYDNAPIWLCRGANE